jgi:hypothetical protein
MKSSCSDSTMQNLPTNDDPRPVPPLRPAADDCCRSGCDPCVFDLYAEALERYRAALKAWEARQKNAGRPASS